jgi:pyrroloquinoline quinone biosynthesis protein E
MLAELTYRCGLQCPYCSNPLALDSGAEELTLTRWCRTVTEAAELGVLQLHLSGGEPLIRRDLSRIVEHAHGCGLYVSLITGGQALSRRRVGELVAAGLDHVQISLQDAEPVGADAIAGRPVHQRKLVAAALVKEAGLALTVNAVLHRGNIGHAGAIIELAVRLGADRLELANSQYYGWALLNRAVLLPTREQLEAAEPVIREARARLAGRLAVVYVVADYHDDLPKACMHGWGTRQLTVAPNGDVLPCPAAAQIPGLGIVNVREAGLEEIWFHSPAFNRFRGTSWMPEPCRSCPRKEIDYGGCRCQAYQLTGDAAATDPVCRFSRHHHLVTGAVRGAGTETDGGWTPRAPVRTPRSPARREVP